MDYPKHTPLAVAAVAAIAGGYAAARPQPAPLAPPHMVAVHTHETLARDEPRADCEKACAHLVKLKCSLGDVAFCPSALQEGNTPVSPNVEASCAAIAQAIDLDDARRMGVRCE